DFTDHVKKIKTQLDGYTGRIGIHAPFWNLTLAAYDQRVRVVVQDRLNHALDAAAEIGATHMVIHSPLEFLGAPASLTSPGVASVTVFDVVRDTLEEIVKRASEIGCTLVIENIYDTSPRLLTDLVASFDSDYVRQSLDTGHAYIMHHHRSAPPPDYYVNTAGELLGHIHIQDTDGYSDRHWAIGEGHINFQSIFNEVAKLDTNPRLILELRDHSGIESSATYLADLGLVT
ncbi:MAG: sugar phosphate isomerase/epimerase family protein, partial [Chloroflexota bacterium]